MSDQSLREQLIEAAARAFADEGAESGCFERMDEWNALADWERLLTDGPGGDMEDCDYYRRKAAAALRAVLPALADAIEASAPQARKWLASHDPNIQVGAIKKQDADLIRSALGGPR